MAKRHKSKHGLRYYLERISRAATIWTGSSSAFILAFLVIVVWLISGPIFQYSDTWQLVINTGTTIVTFLMVFLIQRSQNKESLAVQLKLNELVAVLEGASNRLVDVESLSEDELEILHTHYQELAKRTAKELDISVSHSIEEAESRHEEKIGKQKPPRKKAKASSSKSE